MSKSMIYRREMLQHGGDLNRAHSFSRVVGKKKERERERDIMKGNIKKLGSICQH